MVTVRVWFVAGALCVCRVARRFVVQRVRHKLALYNQEIADLFTCAGREELAKIAMAEADRFEVRHLERQLDLWLLQLKQVDDECLANMLWGNVLRRRPVKLPLVRRSSSRSIAFLAL